MAFPSGERRCRWRLRDVTRAARRIGTRLRAPWKRRPKLSTKVELAQRAPPPVACYLIVLLARHDAPSWSRFLLSPPHSRSSHPSAAAPLYELSFCFVIGISLSSSILPPTSPCIARSTLFSRPSSLQLVLFSLRARRTAELACKSSTREATSSSSKYCGILLARCFVATVTNARRYKAAVFLWGTYISGYDLHNRIIRQNLYCYITNVLFINQLRFCMLHWSK